jgi:hypothetical protein
MALNIGFTWYEDSEEVATSSFQASFDKLRGGLQTSL